MQVPEGVLGVISTHVPHDDNGETTRVPVVPEYVPVNPEIVTRDPVNAPTLPPGTQPRAVFAIASQLPGLPEGLLS